VTFGEAGHRVLSSALRTTSVSLKVLLSARLIATLRFKMKKFS
jgi:hypothetical protein